MMISLLEAFVAILMLQTARAEWMPPEWVLIVGIGITWLTFLFGFLRLRWDYRKMGYEVEKAKRERDKELEEMASRACREFTMSREYRHDADNRMREIANEEIDDAFHRRASSFVSADKFEERSRAMEIRVQAVETALKENTEKIGNMSGQIATAVTTQLTAFLATRVFVKGDGDK